MQFVYQGVSAAGGCCSQYLSNGTRVLNHYLSGPFETCSATFKYRFVAQEMLGSH